MAPMDAIWLVLDKDVLHGYLPTPDPPPYRSATGIGYASKNYLRWQKIQLAVHPIVGG